MTQSQWTLHYAARIRVVLKYYGQSLYILAALMAPILAVGAATEAPVIATWSGGLLCVLAAMAFALNRFKPVRSIRPNESLSVIALVFLTAPLVMMWPLRAAGLSCIDALFESVSGCTTTGLTVLDDAGSTHPSVLFARAWMQWFGGLGFSILSVALVTAPGLVARSLAFNNEDDDLVGSTRTRARTICLFFSIGTAFLFLLLIPTGIGLYDALLFALSSVSTGGFAPRSGSLMLIPYAAQFLIVIGGLAGAMPLAMYARVRGPEWRTPLTRIQGLTLMCAAGFMATLTASALYAHEAYSFADAVRHGFLLGLSAQTTSGFSSVDVSGLSPLTQVLMLPAMIVGGCAGSTAGGLKILRFLILFSVVRTFVRRSGLARHAVDKMRLGDYRIADDDMRSACALLVLYAGVVTVSWMVFLAYGREPLKSLFEVVSAVGTVGLSSGLTASDLPTALKLVLCADMWLGRLEMLAWIVLFTPRTWLGHRMETS